MSATIRVLRTAVVAVIAAAGMAGGIGVAAADPTPQELEADRIADRHEAEYPDCDWCEEAPLRFAAAKDVKR